MTYRIQCRAVLLAGAIFTTLLSSAVAVAQDAGHSRKSNITTDVAVTYTGTLARTTPGSQFWLNGGSADAAVTFYRGLGVAANFTGAHASNIAPGVSLSQVSFMAGPRYTLRLARLPRTHVFTEALFGGAHGFDSAFPGSSGTTSTSSSFSMQLGTGADIAITRGFAIRAFELDYIRTGFPNGNTNSQNDLRVAFGVAYHFSRK
jgi:hypothetical protein